MTTWPTGIPDDFNSGNYRQDSTDTVLRSDVDAGPTKTRVISSVSQDKLSGPILMTLAEQAIFEAWVKTDLKNASLSFDWNRGGNGVKKYLFLKPPRYAFPGGHVKVEIEVIAV